MLIIGLISVKYYFDQKIKVIKTGLSKQENIESITIALDNLGWKYKKRSNSIDLEYEKYILKWTNVVLIPLDEKIIYSFQYHSTTQSGRFPIFIGIRTYLKKKFEKKLHTTLAIFNA
jgi:hypothetical protein